MNGVSLKDYQKEALGRMKNGCILNGGVGSGKSRTSLAYYYTLHGGVVNTAKYIKMVNPCDLYIITTARKRDTGEWEEELNNYKMTANPNGKSLYINTIVIDSWNNIKKYAKIKNSFFIFDEQRVIGYGTWTKAFLEITKHNKWILLSATPGDTWMDYLPVFIANGYFKNKTDFTSKHAVYSRFSKFPKIEKFIGEGYLFKLRNSILVDMDFKRNTISHLENVTVDYDKYLYKDITKRRWNIYENKPIENAGEYCLVLRKLINSDVSRRIACLQLLEHHPKVIIFYNYNYELDILRETLDHYPTAEWNGQYHQPLPTGPKWAYLVQYTAGCEGWNCITTDTIIFYSQNYSYKVMEQARGRIDRMNTPYKDLYYYTFKSKAVIDKTIGEILKRKKKFNEKDFAPKF